MKKILFVILFFAPVMAFSQEVQKYTYVLHGNNLYLKNLTLNDSMLVNGASGNAGLGYTLSVQALTSSPADAGTIYFGQLPKAPVTSANISKVYIRKAGTIKAANIYSYAGTGGTADIRMETDTDANAFFVDASANNIGIGTATPGDKLQVNGNLSLATAGNKLKIATGSNASIGVSGAMTAGTITISTTAVTSSSIIMLVHATIGGTQGILSVGTITNGTSFVINSSNAADTGTVNWWIVN